MLSLLLSSVVALNLIDDCDAVFKKGPDASVVDTLHNKEAIEDCIHIAAGSEDDNIVYLPEGYVV